MMLPLISCHCIASESWEEILEDKLIKCTEQVIYAREVRLWCINIYKSFRFWMKVGGRWFKVPLFSPQQWELHKLHFNSGNGLLSCAISWELTGTFKEWLLWNDLTHWVQSEGNLRMRNLAEREWTGFEAIGAWWYSVQWKLLLDFVKHRPSRKFD